jgi:hypothetical protein
MTYEKMAQHWEETKPIRGRADDLRPIGKRRRDWELITRKVVSANREGDVEYAYCAYLYRTEVVTYYPNGDVGFKTHGWASPLTAEFADCWAPKTVRVCKTKKMLWLTINFNERVPLPNEGELKIRFSDTLNKWVVLDQKPLRQRIIDRKAIADERAKIRGFVNYCKTMLKLSGETIIKETMEQARTKYGKSMGFETVHFELLHGTWHTKWTRVGEDEFKEALAELLSYMQGDEPTDLWDRIFYCFALKETNSWLLDKYGSDAFTVSAFQSRVDFLIKKLDHVYTSREVDGTCFRGNLII